MERFDLAISYTWEYDEDFIHLIEDVFHNNNLSTFIISSHNINEVTELVSDRKIGFHAYLDRASDVDDDFTELGKILNRRKTRIFNPYKNIEHAIDKATMHLEFIASGINTPYSIIIPPFDDQEEIYISISDLEKLGRPFIIKPANTTGGGLGVITGAESLREVLWERTKMGGDKYLIQEKIYPKYLNGNRAWFRCFWAFGKVIPNWWDDQTHIYKEIMQNEKERFNLKELDLIVRKIARLTELDFFSTEIAHSTTDKFIVVDYVNDQCDMRFQSLHPDGVPEVIIHQIIINMLKQVKKLK